MRKFYIILIVLLIGGGAIGQKAAPVMLFDDKAQSQYSSGNIIQRTPGELSLIQLNDSIYFWSWDNIIVGWQVTEKVIDMVYDENNNLLSIKGQDWYSNAWNNTG